jgi:O-antigen biosynthesis protein
MTCALSHPYDLILEIAHIAHTVASRLKDRQGYQSRSIAANSRYRALPESSRRFLRDCLRLDVDRENMTHNGPKWVCVLDIDQGAEVVGVSGPLMPHQLSTRALIRIHGAPVGHVCIPTQPQKSLATRARQAADHSLREQLELHILWDSYNECPDPSQWDASLACPRRFPTSNDAGLSIVICTRNRANQLSACLRTLQEITYSPIEILVVDNAPNCNETRTVVTSLAQDDHRIRYTCESRPGLSMARNHGLARASFELVAFTDDDVIVDPGWATAISAGFASDPEAVCVTGMVASGALDTEAERYFDTRYPWGAAFEPRRYDLTAYRHPSRLYPFKAGIFGTGANFAVRREAVMQLGGFDPLLGAGSPGRGGEDLDLFLRLVLAGGRICYIPSALVWHRHRADIGALGEQVYSYGYGLGAYLAKHARNRKLPGSLIIHGPQQLSLMLNRMRRASEESQLRRDGQRLKFDEARGFLRGAFSYRQASRRATRYTSQPQPTVMAVE